MSIDEFTTRLYDQDGQLFKTLGRLKGLSASDISRASFADWNPWP